MDKKVRFSEALRAWFVRARRTMPWRERRSVYHAVVSEFMLQQTQVSTVIPYFERWVARWKDFDALAAAPESEVLHAWEGLGYYSRAGNLHKLAREISKMKAFPQTAAEWTAFKGVGKYTAAAIASIVQGERVPVVDGNVVRILARVNACENVFKDNSAAFVFFEPFARALLPANGADAGVHNEAMMELGATLCTKANPKCWICPVAGFCKSAGNAHAAELPKFIPKKIEKIEIRRAFVRRGNDEILLVRSAENSKRLRELHELPKWETLFAGTPAGNWIFKGRRAIARESITEYIFAAAAPEKLPENAVFAKTGDLDKITFSGPHRRWVETILQRGA